MRRLRAGKSERAPHLKIIATEFGPLGGPVIPSSWRDKTRVPLLVVVVLVVFKLGGVFPGWSPWSTDLCGSRKANMREVIPVTRNCGTTIKMFCMPWWTGKWMRSRTRKKQRRSTDQNNARFRAQILSGRCGSPISKLVIPQLRDICPAAARVHISHENISVTVSFRVVLVTVTVDIFALDCEQFLVLR